MVSLKKLSHFELHGIAFLFCYLIFSSCYGQIKEREMLFSLTHSSLSQTRYQFFPYTYSPIEVTQPYALALLKSWKNKKIVFYKDKAFTEPYTFERLKKEMYFMRHILKKSYRRRAQLPYQLHLWVSERWSFYQDSLIKRNIEACFWEIKDLMRPDISGLRLYFSPSQCFVTQDLAAAITLNTTASIPIEMNSILKEQNYNFIAPEISENEIIAYQKQAYQLRKNQPANQSFGERQKKILVQIPESLTSENHIAELAPACSLQIEQNYQLFRSQVPILFKDILSGKIPLRYFNSKGAIVPLKVLYSEVERHPLALTKITRRNLEKIDFSFGVKKLEVIGKVGYHKTKGTYFIPEKIGISWYNPEAGLPYVSLGYCKVSQLKKKLYWDTQQFIERLQNGSYYSFICKLNDYGVKSLPAAYQLEKQLKTGLWDSVQPAALIE
jgi:hypothetical protein